MTSLSKLRQVMTLGYLHDNYIQLSEMKFQISQHINDDSGGNLFPIHHIRNIKGNIWRNLETLWSTVMQEDTADVQPR